MQLIDLELEKEVLERWELTSIGAVTRIPDFETYLIDIYLTAINSTKEIKRTISVDYLPFLAVGMIFSNKNNIVSHPIERNNKFILKEIFYEPSNNGFITYLSQIIPDEVIINNNLSSNKLVFCINNANNEDGVHFLLPPHEIARFFFFVDKNITRNILNSTYRDDITIKNNKEDIIFENGKLILNAEISEPYSKSEDKILGWLIISEKARNCADLIFTNIATSKKSIKTKIPIDIECKIHVSGFYLDSSYKYFLVNQIRGCDQNYFEYDELLKSIKGTDHRKFKGLMPLNQKTNNNFQKIFNNKNDITISSKVSPDTNAKKQNYSQIKLKTDIEPIIDKIKFSKEDKLYQEQESQYNKKNIYSKSSKFSTNKFGETGSNVGKHVNDLLDDVELITNPINYEDYLRDVISYLNQEGKKVLYLNHHESTSLSIKPTFITINIYEVAVLRLEISESKYIFLFEVINRSVNENKRLSIFYKRDLNTLNATELKIILNRIYRNGQFNLNQIKGNPFLGEFRWRGFNHYYNNKLLHPQELTKKLINFMDTLI